MVSCFKLLARNNEHKEMISPEYVSAHLHTRRPYKCTYITRHQSPSFWFIALWDHSTVMVSKNIQYLPVLFWFAHCSMANWSARHIQSVTRMQQITGKGMGSLLDIQSQRMFSRLYLPWSLGLIHSTISALESILRLPLRCQTSRTYSLPYQGTHLITAEWACCVAEKRISLERPRWDSNPCHRS